MKGDQIDREGWSVPLKYTGGEPDIEMFGLLDIKNPPSVITALQRQAAVDKITEQRNDWNRRDAIFSGKNMGHGIRSSGVP